MKKIKVKRNIYGNYLCFMGTKIVLDYGSEYDATYWLIDKLSEESYKLSSDSDISQDNIDNFKEKWNIQ